jgi:hypothetical protein
LLGAALQRHVVPQTGERRLEALATVDHDTRSGLAMPPASRSSSTAREAALLSPPSFLIASTTFWPSRRTPSTISSEMAVALRSSRTLTTVPSRISRTMSSNSLASPGARGACSCRQGRLRRSTPRRGATAAYRWLAAARSAIPARPPRRPGERAAPRAPAPKVGDQRARPVPMAAAVGGRAALVTASPERGRELLLQQLLNEGAHLPAHSSSSGSTTRSPRTAMAASARLA